MGKYVITAVQLVIFVIDIIIMEIQPLMQNTYLVKNIPEGNMIKTKNMDLYIETGNRMRPSW